MKRYIFSPILCVILLIPLALNAVTPDKPNKYSDGGVVLRLSEPMGSVLNPGEEIGFSFQPQQDSYVIVFNIDTEGFVNLLYPADGGPLRLTRARDWRSIPERPNEQFVAEGETGIEFVFALTVPDEEAVDDVELGFLAGNENLPRDERYRIDGDPFLAANIVAGELVRGISHRRGVFLDYTYFYINERVSHPCYLCGECDGGETEPLCEEFEITANFDRSSPLTYPLRRAYEMVTPGGQPAADEDVAVSESDDDFKPARVNVVFYPYRSEVVYDINGYVYDYDLDYYLYVWDPWWYDPWICGWHYYPSSRYYWHRWYPYDYYFTWTFGWGWGGGYGYYCSPWYYPRYHHLHDYYYHDYHYDYWRGHRHDRYKDQYDRVTERSPYKYKTSALAAARSYNAKRDSRLKIASSNIRSSYKSRYDDATRVATKDRSTRVKTGSGRSDYKAYSKPKTTRVKNFQRQGSKSGSGSLDVKKSTRATSRSYKAKDTRKSGGAVKSPPSTPKKKTYKGSKSGSNAGKSGTVKQSAPKKASPPKKSSSASKSSKSNRSSSGKSGKSSYKAPSGSSSKNSGTSRSAVRSSGRSSSKSSSAARSSSGSRSGGKSSSGGKSKRK